MEAKDETVAVIESVDIQALITRALEKESPIEVMERLLVMRRELNAERATHDYFAALAAFQAECPVIHKSRSVDYTSKRSNARVKYNYAPLDVIVSAIRGPLRDHGFSYTITTKQEERAVTAICNAHHAGGHSESTEFTVPIDPEAFMNAAQKVASALTYAKRYAFCNAFGILTGDEDDDSQASGAEAQNGRRIQNPQALAGVVVDAEGVARKEAERKAEELKTAQSTLKRVHRMLRRPVGTEGVVLYTDEELNAKVAEALEVRDDIEKLRGFIKAWSEEFTERGASYAFNQEKEKA